MKKFKQVSFASICTLTIVLSGLLFMTSLTTMIPPDSRFSGNLRGSQGEFTTNQMFDRVISDYIDDYEDEGFFISEYEPSLQGTYYALSTLQAVGGLGDVNTTQITGFILSHYNGTSGLFSDDYSERYLDTDSELDYYPLSSLLQVNAYAVLSLEILGELDLIDALALIDFMWECYDGSEGGFIGQQYDEGLHSNFKIATLANTYYAVKVLDTLMASWADYSSERDAIVTFIGSLQKSDPGSDYGGFSNEEGLMLDSLKLWEPNLLSAYYALKTLNIFGMVDTINVDAFHAYLDLRYDGVCHYFKMASLEQYNNRSLYSATAIGLDLGILTGYSGMNQNGIVDFLMMKRNSVGLWDVSTEYPLYELIDTFQVIRSLSEAGQIDQLNASQKNQVIDSLKRFENTRGYGFTSREYTKIETLYAIVNSFKLWDRIGDLPIGDLYGLLTDAYFTSGSISSKGFRGYSNSEGIYGIFRLKPIEFFSLGTERPHGFIDHNINHKFSYMALTTLQLLYKLDDFENNYHLDEIVDSIVGSQILDSGSDYCGAFLPVEHLNIYPIDTQEKFSFFDHAYYAIKTLEFLTTYLGIGGVNDTAVDLDALLFYVQENIVETTEVQYYQAVYVEEGATERLLKHTYFLADLLLTIDDYTLDTQKIKSFVQQNIDYTNIENIYYCYRLDKLLSLGINFDLGLSQSLVDGIYNETTGQLFLTSDQTRSHPEIFYWLSYMAENSEFEYLLSYNDSIQLKGRNTFTVTGGNMVLENLDNSHDIEIESALLGTHPLSWYSEGIYNCTVQVPLDSDAYPSVHGQVNIYEGSTVIASVPFSFETFYGFSAEHMMYNHTNSKEISIIANLITDEGNSELPNGSGFVKTYKGGEFLQCIVCDVENQGSYSHFTCDIPLPLNGQYSLDLYVNDGFNGEDRKVGTYTFLYDETSHDNDTDPDSDPDSDPDPDPELDPEPNPDGDNSTAPKRNSLIPLVIGVSFPSIAVPSSLVGLVMWRKKNPPGE